MMSKSPSKQLQLEQKLLNLRDTDGNVCFEGIDVELASTASRFLPNRLPEEQRELAFLLFCCCHKHTRNGHILFRTETVSTTLPSGILPLPSRQQVEEIFDSLEPSFNQSIENPIYWETANILYIRHFRMTELETARQMVSRIKTLKTFEDPIPNKLPTLPETLTESQLEAVLSPMRNQLTLISGGPGTGKTYTVFQAIRVILHANPEASIQLLAPTGKAVARMQETIRRGLSESGLAEQQLVQVQACTIHRFLSQQQRLRARYQPYPRPVHALDYVIADEASMIDLQLLSRLLDALAPNTRLVMMGDVYQLASVQPGAAFADTFESCRQFNAEKIATIELKNPFRFKHTPELADLCDFIRGGNADEAIALLSAPPQPDALRFIASQSPEEINAELTRWMQVHLLPILDVTSPEQATADYRKSMILCVQNDGPYGVHNLNRTLSKAVAHHRFIQTDPGGETHYWKPIMVRNNDYRLNLFNGDFGVIQQSATSRPLENPVACFQSVEGSHHLHPEHLLPEYSDAYAITVHKSQGSEADHVLLILPDIDSPLLTRELLYTATSRARRSITIIGLPEMIRLCLGRPIQRESRLKERILEASKQPFD